MSSPQLETPSSVNALYYAQGDDVDVNRPVFTGDVFAPHWSHGGDEAVETDAFIVLQHPCALRVGGVDLVDPILCARISQVQGLRSDWAKAPVRQMPLPNLFADKRPFAASFTELLLAKRADLDINERAAVLSQLGVNLLLQRWVHHNSRVVVPTMTYNAQTTGEFEEADLAAEWCAERGANAEAEFHEWIRDVNPETALTRQQQLRDPQTRAAIRRAMSVHLRGLRG